MNLKRGMLLVVFFLFIISAYAQEEVGYDDLQNPQARMAYLQKNFGVQVLSNLDNVQVIKDYLGHEYVAISNTIFNYRGAVFLEEQLS